METKDLENKILAVYPDADLLVLDSNGRGDHFEIRISSESLNKLSRIARHQSILKIFDNEFKSGELHALSVKPLSL